MSALDEQFPVPPIEDVRAALRAADPTFDDSLPDHAVRLVAATYRQTMKHKAEERAKREKTLPGLRLNETTRNLESRVADGRPMLDDNGKPIKSDD